MGLFIEKEDSAVLISHIKANDTWCLFGTPKQIKPPIQIEAAPTWDSKMAPDHWPGLCLIG